MEVDVLGKPLLSVLTAKPHLGTGNRPKNGLETIATSIDGRTPRFAQFFQGKTGHFGFGSEVVVGAISAEGS